MKAIVWIMEKIIEVRFDNRAVTPGKTVTSNRGNVTIAKNMLIIPKAICINNVVVKAGISDRDFAICGG